MTSINNQKIKQFWIKKIRWLMGKDDMKETRKKGNLALDTESNWENKLNGKKNWAEINDYACLVAVKVYQVNQSIFSPYSVPYRNVPEFLKNYNAEAEYYQAVADNINELSQELSNLQTELTNYKNTWDGHTCSSGSTPCSHTDYDTIKREKDNANAKITNLTQEKNNLQTERDHLKSQLSGQTDYDKIKENITKQVITDSGLDLDKNSSLEQVIAKIKELIRKPGDNTHTHRERESNFKFRARKNPITNSNNRKGQNYCRLTKTGGKNYEWN